MNRAVKRNGLLLLGLALAGLMGIPVVSGAVEVGEKAPDFTLPSTTGKKVSLGQFSGKKHVLLEFYVNDFGAT